MTTIADIKTRLALDSQQYVAGMQKAIGTTKGLMQEVSNLGSRFSNLQQITAALAGGGIALVTKRGSDMQRQFQSLGVAFNVSSAGLAKMREIALTTGGNFDQLMGAAEQLSERIGEAFIQKSGAAYDALDAMGLKAAELAELPLDQQMQAVAERIAEMNLSTNEATFLLAELGLSGKEIASTMFQYVEASRQAEEATRIFGLALTDLESQGIAKANESFSVFRQWLEGLTNDFNVAAAPAILAFNDAIGEVLKSLPEARGMLDVVVQGVVILAGSLVSIGEAIMGVGQIVIGVVQAVSGGINTIIGAAAEAIKATINLAIDGINTLLKGWNMIADVVPGLGSAGMIDKFGGGNIVLSTGLADLQGSVNKIGSGSTNFFEGLTNRGAGGQIISDFYANREAMKGGTTEAPTTRNTSGSGNVGNYGGGGSSGGGGGGGGNSAEKAARDAEKAERDRIAAIKERVEAITAAWEREHPYWAELLDYQKEMQVGADDVTKTWTSSFESMGDAISNFVKTGKLDIDSLFASIAENFINLAIQTAMYGQSGGFGGIFGSIMGALGVQGPDTSAALQSYNGNVISRPTKFFANGGLASMAEKGAEAILPLQRNGRGQLGVYADVGGGGQVINNFNTNVTVQGGDTSEETANRTAKMVDQMLDYKVNKALSKQMNTGGGKNRR